MIPFIHLAYSWCILLTTVCKNDKMTSFLLFYQSLWGGIPKMKEVQVVLIFISIFFIFTGCGNSDDNNNSDSALSCESLCPDIVKCDPDTTEAGCKEMCTSIVLSTDCLNTIKNASCDEHAKDKPYYESTCFPPCSDTESDCNTDNTITGCFEGKTMTIYCSEICKSDDEEYTGVCSDKYNDEVSETGDVCWCE